MLISSHFAQLEKDYHLAVVTQLELRQSKVELRQRINQVLKGYLLLIDEIVQEGKKNWYLSCRIGSFIGETNDFWNA